MKYLLAYILPLSCLLGLSWAGPWAFLTPLLAFGLIPCLEMIFPAGDKSATTMPGTIEFLYDLLVYMHLPFLYYLLIRFGAGIEGGLYEPMELMGLTFSMGIILGTFGMNLGHELGHRQGWLNQLFANLFWLPNLYMHFGIEHNLWHHKYVATDDDPASAPEGMSLYRFWWVSVTGNIKTAWKVEKMRLARSEQRGINKVILIIAIEIIYLSIVFFMFGLKALSLVVVAGIIGFLLLESVNYVEHYGLRRQKLQNGRYETQGPEHSWNSNHLLGRIILYELVRHPDHHLHAAKKYQTLKSIEGSPQLPFGYPACILMAFIPSLWKKRMGKALSEFHDSRI